MRPSLTAAGARAWLLPGGVAAGLTVALAAALYPFFLPDDLFIYLRFARNLVGGDGASFNPGEPTYGFTSPFWLGLLVAARWTGAAPVVSARLLSALAAGAAALAAAAFCRRAGGTAAAAWAGALLLAVDVWFVRWSLTGMEAALSAALLLAGLARRVAEEDAGRGPAASTAILALLALVRPEALLLVGLAVLDAAAPAAPARAVRWRRGLRAAVSAAVVLGPWMAIAWVRFGTLVPDTAPAKGTLGAPMAQAAEALLRVGMLAGPSLAVPALLAVAALATGRGPAGGWSRHRLLLAWGVGLPLLYAAAGVTAYSRYLLAWTPALMALGIAAGWKALAPRRRGGAAFAAAVVASALIHLTLGAVRVAPASAVYGRSFRQVNVALGQWLAAHTPPGTVVAAENIGAIGYYSDRRILDMNGLVTPEVIPYKRGDRVDDFLAAARPDYIVKIDRRPDPWGGGLHGLRLEVLQVLPYEGMFLDQTSTLYYTLYRVVVPGSARVAVLP